MLILFVNDNTRLSDDVVFVCEVSWENVYVLKVLLRGFEMTSDLKINFAKSQFGIFGG